MKRKLWLQTLVVALVLLTVLSTTASCLAVGRSSTLAKKGAKYIVYCKKLNFRAGASINSTVRKTLRKGTKVTFLKDVRGWWYVKLPNGQKGYVDKQFLTPKHVPKPDFYRTKKKVTLRAAPRTSAKALLVIDDDNWPKITKVNGDWGRTTWKGKTGWIALKYVE